MTIQIGLAGWGDHDDLYAAGVKPGDKLAQYANHFPLVEVDSTFYAIQSRERFAKWVADTPSSLHFVVKAYQGMTGHQRGKQEKTELAGQFAAFRHMLEPAIEVNRLRAALFQYPPWFQCNSENVRKLREAKAYMEEIPCALEFRHESWFSEKYSNKTIEFMENEGWIHSVCDEPQAGEGSIPTVLRTTNKEMTLVRFHGRNVSGWSQSSAPNWREVRYLYRYSEEELKEWAGKLQFLEQTSEHVCVIFNNNSGGDAAHNAKQMMELLGQKRPDGKPPLEPLSKPEQPGDQPEQLELF